MRVSKELKRALQIHDYQIDDYNALQLRSYELLFLAKIGWQWLQMHSLVR